MFSARQIADAQAQITSLQAKLTSLQANYAALLQTTQRGATNALRVIEPAPMPASPIPSHRMTTMLLAAAIGLVLGCSAIYLLEYLDDTLKTPYDVAFVPKNVRNAVPIGGASLVMFAGQSEESKNRNTETRKMVVITASPLQIGKKQS